MLKTLSIQNYALIQELELSPASSLNIITGETGAGKSILLGAIGLLLGNRADIKALLDTKKKCIIEGVFDIQKLQLQAFFKENDIEFDTECIIRREISPSGKSRAFVNDSPANLSILKTLGNALIDIHSQHESLEIGNNSYQLETLDAFAQNQQILSEYQQIFKEYSKTTKKLAQLEENALKSSQESDYQNFILKELEEIPLDELDQEALENELKTQENIAEIKTKISQLLYLFDESEYAIIQQLNEGKNVLSSLNHFSNDFAQLQERLESVSIELADISSELNTLQDEHEHEPERAEEVRELLDKLYRVQKKHGKFSVEELIAFREELSSSVDMNANMDEQIAELKTKKEELFVQIQEIGSSLTDSREKAAVTLGISIEEVIRKIGIENGSIHIKIAQQTPTLQGLDTIEFLFSANKGIEPQPLKNVASGGEFSRLIFAIKFLLANKTNMPTLIFDEIDTGVSGQIAMQMIKMMKEISQNHQIISISHLPQFAAGADKHYYVFKDHQSEKTISKIKELSEKERKLTIAQMIGGEHPSEAAINSAEELIGDFKN